MAMHLAAGSNPSNGDSNLFDTESPIEADDDNSGSPKDAIIPIDDDNESENLDVKLENDHLRDDNDVPQLLSSSLVTNSVQFCIQMPYHMTAEKFFALDEIAIELI